MRKGVLVFFGVLTLVASGQFALGQQTTGTFPLGGSMAGDRDLPRPFGIGVNVYYQNQDYDLTSIDVNLPPFWVLPPIEALDVDSKVTEINAKFDLWLFPFVNVFGILGYVEGETKVDLAGMLDELNIEYDGMVYGGGFTVAAGTERFFGSFTTIYTDTDLDVTDSSIKTWVLTPKGGVRFPSDGVVKEYALWGGAMFQLIEEKHQGSLDVPGLGPVDFDVELEEADRVNYLGGLTLNIAHRWQVEFEGGFGNRKHVLGALTYRFTK